MKRILLILTLVFLFPIISLAELEKGEGDVQFEIQNGRTYGNKIELSVSSYTYYLSTSTNLFENVLPVTVYYNDTYEHLYKNKYRVKFEILKFEVSNEGVLYAEYGAEDDNYYAELKATTKYKLEDGTYVEEERCLGTWGVSEDGKAMLPIMEYYGQKSDPKPISAEIYIDLVEEE